MIHYKNPLAKLKAKGYTTTDLRKEKVLSQFCHYLFKQ